MAVRVTQTSYNSGELGELMVGRVDDSKYAAGLRLCKNAIVTPQGPVKNRSGFRFVHEVKYPGRKTLLIPFTYSADQTMIVELGDHYARFHTLGQTLMTADGSSPYEIRTPWEEGDLYALHYTQNADIMTFVHPRYAPQELRRYSMTDWRLVGVVLTSTLAAPTGVGATRRTAAANDDNADKYTQRYVVTALNEDRTQESIRSAEASVVANLFATGTTVQISWNGVPGATYYRVYKYQGGLYGYIGETRDLSIVDDNVAPETGTTPPYVDDVFKVSRGIMSVDVLTGGSGYGTSKYITGYVNTCTMRWAGDSTEYPRPLGLPKSAQSAANVYWQVVDPGGNGSGADFQILTGQADDLEDNFGPMFCITGIVLKSGGVGYSDPKLAINCHGRKGELKWTYTFPLTCAFDVPEIVVEDPTGYGAVLKPVIVNGVITSVTVVYPGIGYTNPKIRVVSKSGSGATFRANLSDAGDYPAAVGYFEQRRIFAGTRLRPQQIWMTATGTESNMTYHLPLQDTDRISFAVASRELNQIQHVVALQQLIMLTSAAEWRVSPLNSDAITPSSISVRPQSYIGASSVQPQVINTNLLYAAARGGHVRELSYDYTAGGYITGDISIRAPHLFSQDNVVTQMALTKSPDPYLWCTRADGVLLGLCYVPEQKIGAWFQYQTQGRFESVSVVQEGKEDYLYAIVKRTINGRETRYIERQALREDDRDGCYLDCAGRANLAEPSKTISGLTWLEGMPVVAVADGAVYRGMTVRNGQVTFPVPVRRAWVGLSYETVLKTLPVTLQAQDGSLGRGHIKNVNRLTMRIYQTSGIEAGPDEENMKAVKPRRREAIGLPPELYTGEIDLGVVGTWQADGTVCIRQAEPLPFTLVYHSAEVEIGG